MESLSDSYSFLTYSCAILDMAIWNKFYCEKVVSKCTWMQYPLVRIMS